ncbi:MAG: hypothetical protein QUU85_15195, partial [Candidatus Eisenbacteria bacterium]|nr:hypothetical protein [Candidatus Eisenbacteria bacterium]
MCIRDRYEESQPLVAALDFLEHRYPQRLTILSDPISSYAIPAYTHHDAVSPFQQHSSPSDSTVDDRLRDVQEALNGSVGPARTFEVLRRYGVDMILLNQSWGSFVDAYYVFISPLAYERQRKKFDGAPDLFEKVYDADGIALYAVHDPGPTVALPQGPPPEWRTEDPGNAPILRAGPVALLRAAPRDSIAPIDGWLCLDLLWRRTEEPYRFPAGAEIKVQHHTEDGRYGVPVLGRLLRVIDATSGKRMTRFGQPFRPLATFYPDFLWKPGEVYRDELWLHVPEIAIPGMYDIYLRLGVEPYAPVAWLDEMVSNRLRDDWKKVGEVRIGD